MFLKLLFFFFFYFDNFVSTKHTSHINHHIKEKSTYNNISHKKGMQHYDILFGVFYGLPFFFFFSDYRFSLVDM